MKCHRFVTTLVLAAFAVTAMPNVWAQALNGPPANPQYKYSTETPPGVEVPATVDTRIGKLHFFDGFPDQARSPCRCDFRPGSLRSHRARR